MAFGLAVALVAAPERLRDARGGDVVVGRADPAGREHVAVARTQAFTASMIALSSSGTTRASAIRIPASPSLVAM